MLREGTRSKKQKMPFEVGPSTLAIVVPPPLVHTKVPPLAPLAVTAAESAAPPPPPATVAPQGEPLMPSLVREALDSLEVLSKRIISHLENMRISSIALSFEWRDWSVF